MIKTVSFHQYGSAASFHRSTEPPSLNLAFVPELSYETMEFHRCNHPTVRVTMYPPTYEYLSCTNAVLRGCLSLPSRPTFSAGKSLSIGQ
uniref:Uncharacterized protein n=1 Tax=Utricularia reniformis TaxID=192314 RepID=A0A1Y0B1Q4_9LAMI|nr:hypothetical protein AEK19_MT1107 [Utricularia reniformis]ART31327.1 hypothetical protein AEK19_MT1107 [Utricularia reniformis]